MHGTTTPTTTLVAPLAPARPAIADRRSPGPSARRCDVRNPALRDAVDTLAGLVDDAVAAGADLDPLVRSEVFTAVDALLAAAAGRAMGAPPTTVPGWVLIERATARLASASARGDLDGIAAPPAAGTALRRARALVDAHAPATVAAVETTDVVLLDGPMRRGEAGRLVERLVQLGSTRAVVVTSTVRVHSAELERMLDVEVRSKGTSIDTSWFVSERRARDVEVEAARRGVAVRAVAVPPRLLRRELDGQLAAGDARVVLAAHGRHSLRSALLGRRARRAGHEVVR